MILSDRQKGIVLAITGAFFWGVGGVASDWLFTDRGISVNWYVTARLLISGVFLVAVHRFMSKGIPVFSIFKEKSIIIRLIIFSILGMLLVQYSYMASIDYGNAAIATLLQYLAPVYIILWYLLKGQERMTGFDAMAIFLTLAGTFLLLTNGSFRQLSVPLPGIVWGVVSGFSLAFYTVYARGLLIRYPSLLVVGWAMIIAGGVMHFIHPVWAVETAGLDAAAVLVLLFGIFAGTAIAFWFFIKSLEYITAKETTLFGTIEPLAAIVASVLVMNVAFQSWQLFGMFLILVLITMLSLKKQSE